MLQKDKHGKTISKQQGYLVSFFLLNQKNTFHTKVLLQNQC